MKFRKFLSGLLFGLGCALTFVGLLTIVLPSIDNPQLQLVLASFSMESPDPLVSLINRFMAFSLLQNWRMLYLGILIAAASAWLLLHFTPSKACAPSQSAQPAPPPAIPQEAEQINPFAVDYYSEPLREEQTHAKVSSMLHSEPILERNQVESTETPVANPLPYVSTRLATESRAIETEAGALSQSGSRILVRTSYEPIEPAAQVLSEEPASPRSEAPDVSSSSCISQPPPVRSSPRIRSTMGRHSSGSAHLPHSRS